MTFPQPQNQSLPPLVPCHIHTCFTELQEVESIFSSLQTACKTISNLVRRSSLSSLTGLEDSGSINVQGEEQKKLDVITNDVLKRALQYTGELSSAFFAWRRLSGIWACT